MGEFPNKDTQFQKGKSGNPAGRPKGARNMSTILRERLEANGGKSMEEIIDKAIDMAKSGDFKYFQQIYDRLEGKTPDRLAGPDGEGLKIIIEGITDSEGDDDDDD